MNTNDNGDGSLRDVINHAASGDTIQFNPTKIAAGSTITLTSGAIPITNKDLTINGLAMNITINGNNTSRIFNITQGSAVEIDNLSFEGWGCECERSIRRNRRCDLRARKLAHIGRRQLFFQLRCQQWRCRVRD